MSLLSEKFKCIFQVYEYLLEREKMCLVEEDFMARSPSTPKMRGILVDWLIQVHTRFHLLPETLHLTIYLLDMMLSRTKVDKGELQLVGVASMLVASKYEEMYAPDIHDFEYITDNAYSKKQILKMETKILIATDFDLSRPHSLTFLRWYSKEMKFGVRMHHMAKFLIEVCFFLENVRKYSLKISSEIHHTQMSVREGPANG
ncbi:cyclin domain protein [Cooperia oncophora]